MNEKSNAENAQNEPLSSWQARLSRLALGKPTRYGGLCLYPLLGDDLGMEPYLLLDAALESGALIIEEKKAGATVPELALTNHGDARVLLVDGEELVGAKQNRIVNTTVLVDAHSTLLLPVTCVEAGRWRQDSARFTSGHSHYNARGRQKKAEEVSEALSRSGRHDANQARVWADIGGKLDRLAVASDTAALHDVTRAHAAGLSAYGEALAAPAAHQVGAAFALGRTLIGLDLFDQARTLAALLPKLVASYALDALEESGADAPPPPSVVADWLRAIPQAAPDPHPAVGLGKDIRLSAPRLSGAALEFGGVALHLSVFQKAPASPFDPHPMPRLARATQRRG